MEAPAHEQAWAAALEEEHGHQRELLATLRDELGTFAKECASALTAVEAFAGLAGVAGILASAATDVRHASLVLEVGRRLGVPGHDQSLEQLYGTLGRGKDAPPTLVRHASQLLQTKEPRSDRDLLSAVVSTAGSASGIEGLLGPAPWTALAALQPLARWAPQLAKLRRGEASKDDLPGSATSDLSQVLEATAQLGAGAGAMLAGEAAALAGSLRDAVQHVEAAATSVKDGKLAQVLAEMRRTLEADLDKLRGIHEGAHEAPSEWREARRAEHTALHEEVHAKLDRVERIRGALGTILPHLQAVARTLSVVQKLHALDGRIEPQVAAGVEAASLTVLAGLGTVWDGAFGGASAPAVAAAAPAARPARNARARWAVLAAAALAAAIVGIVLTRGSGTPAAPPASAGTTTTPTTTATPPPAAPKPKLQSVAATFDPAPAGQSCAPPFCTTTYVESATGSGLHYRWSVSIPSDKGCAAGFEPNTPKPNEATWYHADVTEGGSCSHANYDAAGFGHPGWVTVVVSNGGWSCTARFHGTQGAQAQLSSDGRAPSACRPAG